VAGSTKISAGPLSVKRARAEFRLVSGAPVRALLNSRRLLRLSTVTPKSTFRRQPKAIVLILSSDAVAAALVGALVETLGYGVRFHHPPEDPTETLRRERPDLAMVDGSDQLMFTDALLGHAAMREVDVVVFGSREALARIRAAALAHRIHTLITPPSLPEVSELLSELLADRH
jgi:CheY-like chemotaxis protein